MTTPSAKAVGHTALPWHVKDCHEHYDQLTEFERCFVDDQFTAIFREGKAVGVALHGDDDAEIAVDALARLVLLSRADS